MVTKTLKYLKVIQILWSMSLQSLVEYRASFILTTISINLWLGIDIAWILIIYKLTDNFAGLSIWEYILFLGIYFLWINFYWFVFTSGLASMSKYIYDGELDKWLIKPIDSQFSASIRGFDLPSLASSLFGLVVVVVAISNLENDIQLTNILLFLVMFILSFITFYSIIFIIYTYTFWGGRMTALEGFVESFVDSASSIPANAYNGILRIIIYFVIPIAMITTIPLHILIDSISLSFAIYYIVFTVLITIAARLVWHLGLRSYTSVSG